MSIKQRMNEKIIILWDEGGIKMSKTRIVTIGFTLQILGVVVLLAAPTLMVLAYFNITPIEAVEIVRGVAR